ncbi:hypothetical protein KY330_05300 [Candidatus Woesearchaeota archaeon]|nr:hypothetical protein [Candidatus Woesearchaeota archaeon]
MSLSDIVAQATSGINLGHISVDNSIKEHILAAPEDYKGLIKIIANAVRLGYRLKIDFNGLEQEQERTASLMRDLQGHLGFLMSEQSNFLTFMPHTKLSSLEINLGAYRFARAPKLSHTIRPRRPIADMTKTEALSKAKKELYDRFYGNIEQYLEIARENEDVFTKDPLIGIIESEYKKRVSTAKKEAVGIIERLQGLPLTIQQAYDGLDYEDYVFFKDNMNIKDKSQIQGVYGEILGLGIVKHIISEYPEKDIKAGFTLKDQYIPRNIAVKYRKNKQNLVIKDFRSGVVCEVDNLLVYEGVPIVFESKTGRDGMSLDSYQRQKTLLSDIYGVSPYFVEVRVKARSYLEKREDDWYILSFPVQQELMTKTDSTFEKMCRRLW